MDHRERADRIEPTEPNDKIDRIEPADPMDRIDPADPIDRIDPVEPIDRIDPVEPIDRIDPGEPMAWIAPGEPMDWMDDCSVLRMRAFSQPRRRRVGCDAATVQRALGLVSATVTPSTYARLRPTAEYRTGSTASMLADTLVRSGQPSPHLTGW